MKLYGSSPVKGKIIVVRFFPPSQAHCRCSIKNDAFSTMLVLSEKVRVCDGQILCQNFAKISVRVFVGYYHICQQRETRCHNNVILD